MSWLKDCLIKHPFDCSISATVGSYILSVKLAGYMYDQQVASLKAAAVAAGEVLNGPIRCVGPQCFRSVRLSREKLIFRFNQVLFFRFL